jgi:hypothetical protein
MVPPRSGNDVGDANATHWCGLSLATLKHHGNRYGGPQKPQQ